MSTHDCSHGCGTPPGPYPGYFAPHPYPHGCAMVPPPPHPNPVGPCAKFNHPDIMHPHNQHLFLEENPNQHNSFIRNVNLLSTHFDVLKVLADHICAILTVACRAGAIDMIADHIDYVNFIAKNVDTIISLISQNTGQVFRFTDTIVMDTDQPELYVITFNNEAARYLPGSNTLMVSYNGCECYKGEQFSEVGTIGELSNRVQMLFPLRKGDEIHFKIISQS